MRRKISIELDDDVAVELDRLAAADGAEMEDYAASLLAQLVRAPHLDPERATELLRGMPGALAAAREGSAQARRGEVTSLDAL